MSQIRPPSTSLFPASYSTLSSMALASYLSDCYGWFNAKCELLLRGVGDTYIVHADRSKYIFRAYRPDLRTYTQIGSEVELLLLLKQSDVAVSYPVADKKNTLIHSFEAVEGTKYGVLFTFAPGQMVPILEHTHLKTLGREMARFHEVSAKAVLKNERWYYNNETTLAHPLKAIRHLFEAESTDYKWLLDAAAKATEALTTVDDTSFSKGYCHYDFMPKNFHFDDKGQVTFFDFDFLGYGWLVNDLMSFRVSLSLDVHYGKISQARANSSFDIFLEAYRTQKVVSDLELSTLPYLELGFWLFYMGFYTTHDQFFPLLQEPHLKRRLALIRSLTEKNELLSWKSSL